MKLTALCTTLLALCLALTVASCTTPIVLTGDPVKDCLAGNQAVLNAQAQVGPAATASAIAASFSTASPRDRTALRNAELAQAALIATQSAVTQAVAQAAVLCTPKP